MPTRLLTALASASVAREGRKLLGAAPAVTDSFLRPHGDRPQTLYLHIPFCLNPCPFCAFHRYTHSEPITRSYFEVLAEEVDLYLERGFRFGEFYLGGGTPTILPDELARLLRRISRTNGSALISLETYPLDLTVENVALLVDLGVNRLSVGAQSFEDRLLRAMGRSTLTGAQVADRLELVRGRFETLQVDLLYNHPLQTESGLRRDLGKILDLEVEQVTFNPLMPPLVRGGENGAPLELDGRKGDYFYDIIIEELTAAGYRPSTVWCFSKRPGLIDEYIARSTEYLAAGCGATGFHRGTFYANSFSLERYSKLIGAGRLPVALAREFQTAEAESYHLLTTLFGMGTDREGLYRLLSKPALRTRFFLGLARLFGLTRDGFRLTRRGMPVVSRMMREFFGVMTALRERCIAEGI